MDATAWGERERNFLKEKFKGYYRKNLPVPSRIHDREFGFGFDRKIEYRHKAFPSQESLQEFIQREGPLFISYSAACYRYPDAQPMEKKEFLDAELIFDLDAGYPHDFHNPVVCLYCLERVRDETVSLIEDFVLKDFGFSEKEVSANFSGQKGYHVHVDGEAARQLSQEARRQLSLYVTAKGLDVERIFLRQELGNRRYLLRGPSAQAKGWAGRLYSKAKALIEKGDEKEMRAEGVKPSQIKFILENKAAVLQKMSEGNWDLLKGLEGTWKGLLDKTVKLKSINVDDRVSYDMSRLIRLPSSLHGDTGLMAKKMPLKELASFDPSKDAVFFSNSAQVSVKGTVDTMFTLGGGQIELKEGQEKELPESAAVMLVCKRKALLA